MRCKANMPILLMQPCQRNVKTSRLTAIKRGRNSMRQLRLTTLGGLRFHFDGDCEIRLSTRKTAALMVYLCMHAGRRLAREALCGLLWGDKSEIQARHSLSQALSEARKAFGDDFIQTDGCVVWINASRVWVDAFELTRLAIEKTLSSL